MRKGADCLSKWVGEAERQLRMLFEEATKQQPSIIFFDELDGECGREAEFFFVVLPLSFNFIMHARETTDTHPTQHPGLAPVRSSRQDQVHSSIVSTLLALMDGLDSRGQVIVIGATNRIDSIDPALRR